MSRRETSLGLLLVLVASAIAAIGIALAHVSAARATFADAPCFPSGAINYCPGGTVGAEYGVQLLGRDGTGCWPFDTFRLTGDGAPPPGITLSSGGLLSGTPTAAGTWLFYVEMNDFAGPSDTWCLPKSFQRQMSITIQPGSSPPPPLPYYWHLTAGSTVLHSELAVTYPDGTTGLGDMLRWEQGHKDTVRSAGSVLLARVRASS